jgi:NADP-reducing hydrogenase subunit HndD
MEPGSVATGQLVMALKRAGFHFVFDTNFGADLTIMEEGTEFAQRLKSGGLFPMFSTCCPCWINLLEKEVLPKEAGLSSANCGCSIRTSYHT